MVKLEKRNSSRSSVSLYAACLIVGAFFAAAFLMCSPGSAWAYTYKVSYYANGGTQSTEPVYCSSLSKYVKFRSSDGAMLASATEDGTYTVFQNWYTDKAADDVINVFDIANGTGLKKSGYALSSLRYYRVGSPDSTIIVSNGNNTSNADWTLTPRMLNGGVAPQAADLEFKLYANWSPAVSFYYHLNGGTVTTDTTQEVQYRALSNVLQKSSNSGATWSNVSGSIPASANGANLYDADLAEYHISRTGYHIIPDSAWNSRVDGRGNDINQADADDNVERPNRATAQRVNSGKPVTSAVSTYVYINWKPNEYNITYDIGTGNSWPSGTPPENLHALYDVPVFLPSEAPDSETKVFKGWSIQPNGTGPFYQAGSAVKNLTSANGATVTLYAQWGDPDTVVRNSYSTGFDVTVYKDGPETQEVNSPDVPVAGAKFEIFQISGGLGGTPSSPTLPAVLSTRSAFEAAFSVDPASSGTSLSYDSAALEAAGLSYAGIIETGEDGYASTSDALLDSGEAYAIIEVSTPKGYLLNDSSTSGGSTTFYVVDDKVSVSGADKPAHAFYSDSYSTVSPGTAGKQVDLASLTGAQTVGAEHAGFSGYRVVMSNGSNSPTITADCENRFHNPRSPEPRGGLKIQKVDADTGQGLAGASFAIWEESAFNAKYNAYRQAMQSAGEEPDDGDFLTQLLEGGSDDPDEDEVQPSPYYLEPACELGETDGTGWASTGKTELLAGNYIVVEISPPLAYFYPEYDFVQAGGGTSGCSRVTVTEDNVVVADAISNKPMEVGDSSSAIEARKTFSGGTLVDGMFEFELYQSPGESEIHEADKIAAVMNNAEGLVSIWIGYSEETDTVTFMDSTNGGTSLHSELLDGRTSLPLLMRERVPEHALAEIDEFGRTAEYGDYVSRMGYDSASNLVWQLDDICYDATLWRVNLSFREDMDTGEMELFIEYPDGNIEFNNSALYDGTLKIKKENPEGEGLQYAQFEVTSTLGESVFSETITSNGDGFGYLEDIPYGSYTIREVVPPSGYLLNPDWNPTVTITEASPDADISASDPCVDEEVPLPPPTWFAIGGLGFLGIAALGAAAFLGFSRNRGNIRKKLIASGLRI